MTIEFLNSSGSNFEFEIEFMCEKYLKEIGADPTTSIKLYWEKLHPKNYASVGGSKSEIIIALNILYVGEHLGILEDEELKPSKEIGLILAHEFIHVKQIINEELVYLDEERKNAVWKQSETYPIKVYSDFDTDEAWAEYYHSLPWEIEAHKKQDALFEKYKEHKEFAINNSFLLKSLLAA